MSALTGESVPVPRGADVPDEANRVLESPVLVFSGTVCTAGSAGAVVHATGAHTELGAWVHVKELRRSCCRAALRHRGTSVMAPASHGSVPRHRVGSG